MPLLVKHGIYLIRSVIYRIWTMSISIMCIDQVTYTPSQLLLALLFLGTNSQLKGIGRLVVSEARVP